MISMATLFFIILINLSILQLIYKFTLHISQKYAPDFNYIRFKKCPTTPIILPRTIDIIVIATGLFLSSLATRIITGIAIRIATTPPLNHHKLPNHLIPKITNGTIK